MPEENNAEDHNQASDKDPYEYESFNVAKEICNLDKRIDAVRKQLTTLVVEKHELIEHQRDSIRKEKEIDHLRGHLSTLEIQRTRLHILLDEKSDRDANRKQTEDALSHSKSASDAANNSAK